ncbi:hypothetical protein [Oryzicola mucosus]|uniref:HK97 gp10 family phage protein n=1 Tax=Oryzicola mucosus TaxID=2767425 RepID=A0A8J6PYG9_9HYPH|nr:hypothetical protein [Oryzicola mucosus]MBD0416507.1 hypothetical protein [Oryzicola mucosus]
MSMKFVGFERLRRKMARIPDSIKKRAQADLMLAGREINMLQRALAPQDDGVLRGTIRTEPINDAIGPAVAIRAGGPETTKPVRDSEKGTSPEIDYAVEQEYGNEHMKANAYFWPGYRARKKQARKRMVEGMRMTLKKGGK